MSAVDDHALREAEQRGKDAARLTALEEHAKAVNGQIGRLATSLEAFRQESSRENTALRESITTEGKSLRESISTVTTAIAAITSEKRSVISLQNRQVAFMAAVGTVIFLLVEHVHP